MINNLELAQHSVQVAQVITWTAFGAVTLTTVAGFAEGVSPGITSRIGTWVYPRACKALRFALSALYVVSLAWAPRIAYRLAVTYLHVPTFQPAGHRYSMVRAWREGTYSASRPHDVITNYGVAVTA
jgi:hypothetical protein